MLLRKQGFTLVELLVVVLIIGILAAVALPQYQKAVYKSRMAGLQQQTRLIKNALEMYFIENGHYTTNLDELDITYPTGGTEWRCNVDLGEPEVVRCVAREKYDITLQYFLDNNSKPSFIGRSHCFAYNNNPLAKNYCISSGMTSWSMVN